MSPHIYAQLTDILSDVERQLRVLSLWAEDEPSAEQLASIEPFCIDTLSFPQWLQFVFLPRIRFLLDARQPLPAKSQISPMA